MPEIAVLGNFVVDIIGKPIERLPEPGQLAFGNTLETHVGGNGPNTAAALGKLGASVAVFGRVGDDLYGRFGFDRIHFCTCRQSIRRAAGNVHLCQYASVARHRLLELFQKPV